MASIDKEVAKILSLLRNKIRESGHTQVEVQRKLHWGRSYLSQMLNQQKGLRVDQVLAVLKVIQVEPREFFAELYQLPRPEAHLRNIDEYAQAVPVDLQRFTETFGEGEEGEERLSEGFFRNYRELRAMVRAMVQVLVEKEIVSIEEFAEKAREAGLRRET